MTDVAGPHFSLYTKKEDEMTNKKTITVDVELDVDDDFEDGTVYHFQGDSLESASAQAFRAMTELCGRASADKGWHTGRPTDPAMLGHWQGNKLMLMVSELVEAHDELRNGHAADETYYNVIEFEDTEPFERKPSKPEGVPSELADTVIRVFDFCYTEGIDLGAIIEEKLAYNRTREQLHGGKKF